MNTCLMFGRAAPAGAAGARSAATASAAARAPLRISDLVALEELLADDHPLDLRRALSDKEQRRVAVQALDLVLLRVPVAPVDAEGVLHDLLAGLRGEELGHARLEIGALTGVLEPGRLEGQEPRGLHLRGHVGELELDRLVLGDRLAKG